MCCSYLHGRKGRTAPKVRWSRTAPNLLEPSLYACIVTVWGRTAPNSLKPSLLLCKSSQRFFPLSCTLWSFGRVELPQNHGKLLNTSVIVWLEGSIGLNHPKLIRNYPMILELSGLRRFGRVEQPQTHGKLLHISVVVHPTVVIKVHSHDPSNNNNYKHNNNNINSW